ncbi:hypothetical protein SAMN05216330_11846 [Bradyrhizobium sp. Ghvi]|nr:hypothetical protein SAMN05216330_11846 [Bradyrhizobium sp. Ghvi]
MPGHDARLMPAKYVRPFSKGQKNDFRDAEAIAEAVQRATMKFVATKTAEQLDLQARQILGSRTGSPVRIYTRGFRPRRLVYPSGTTAGLPSFPGALSPKGDPEAPAHCPHLTLRAGANLSRLPVRNLRARLAFPAPQPTPLVGVWSLRMRSLPSIVPADRLDRDIYLVLEDFGARAGCAWRETDEQDTDCDTVLRGLICVPIPCGSSSPTPSRAGPATRERTSPMRSPSALLMKGSISRRC